MARKELPPGIKEANWQANKRLAVIEARMGRSKMAKRKKFKLKTLPLPPDERMIREEDKEVWSDTYTHQSLSGFIAELQGVLREYPDAEIKSELEYGHCFYEGDRPSYKLAVTVRRKNDADYNKQFKAYIKKTTEYNEWYAANKDQIEQELKLRELDEITDRELRAQALEKEAKRLRKLNPDGG